MSLVFEIDPNDPESWTQALYEAVHAIEAGELIVMPTETVYGIACRPDDPKATQRLFEAKRRPTDLNLPVLCGSEESAWEIAVPNDAARRLARAFWPGPLTMVLERTGASKSWDLGARKGTIGVRVPDHRFANALLSTTGPLAVSSANLSGRPPGQAPDLITEFEGLVSALLVIAPAAEGETGPASTVVDMTGDSVSLLREGAIGAAQVLRAATG